jgi:PBP1b-binding outer membrane lipoprotein LpoB
MKTGFREIFLIALSVLVLAGCSAMRTSAPPKLEQNARWVLLPGINNTETPAAGARLDSILASLLRVHGVRDVRAAPGVADGEAADGLPVVVSRQVQDKALEWARAQHAAYAIAGAVDEWRYKTGLDGEPAVAISLSIIDVKTAAVIWSGSAAKTGWSRQAVSAVAIDMVDQLLDSALADASH